jgi:hypothetical protein
MTTPARARVTWRAAREENTRRQEQEADILAEAKRTIENNPDVGAEHPHRRRRRWHRVIGIVGPSSSRSAQATIAGDRDAWS